MVSRSFILLIKFYKYFISPMLGQHCRFYPSCSSYSLLCFKEMSFLKALCYSIIRLLKCNPFFKGGYDPIPSKKTEF